MDHDVDTHPTPSPEGDDPSRLGRVARRDALRLIGGAGLVALVGCSNTTTQTSGTGATPASSAGSSSTAAGAIASSTTAASAAPGSTVTTTTPSGTCTLAPDVTQGPFWLTDHPNTADLVQDRRGVPLALGLTVVDRACRPLANAKVDIWHCDATGNYAGVSGGSGPGGPPGGGGAGGAATRSDPNTWLQGWQATGSDGTVTFKTIYPGYYSGRAVHIHLKVFVSGKDVHTGQLFFPDEINNEIFASAPYRGAADTPNAADSIFRGAGSAALITPTKNGAGYTATAQLVVAG